jgi:hypothetical protein
VDVVSIRRRPAALTAVALLALVVVSGAAARPEGASTVRFGSMPRQLVKGELAAVTAAVKPARASCTLSGRFADGRRRSLGATRAVGGRAEFRFRVPDEAAAGTARLTVACRGAGSRTTALRVVAAEGGRASVRVDQRGFSQRWRGFSSSVSYGLVLSNPSPSRDAVAISAVVNFVDESNRVVQTHTQRLAGIRAGSMSYLGGFVNIPEGIAVTRLEVNFRHGQAPRGTLREPPTEDLRITPQIGDPAFVGAVQGQVLNDHPRYLLGSAKISIVVFDAAGNVTGGTQAYASAVLLPGARSYFSGSGGLNAVPFANAVTARTTVEPTYAAG